MLSITPDRLPSRRPHRKGFGNTQYAHMAMSMLLLAVAAGVAIFRIGQSRERSCYVSAERLAQEHIANLKRLASYGVTSAQIELADAFADGTGVPQDLAAAAHWNQIAADAGDTIAQENLARAYVYGSGVPQD